MLEQHVIQSRGFRNVDGGFQVAVRCPYYRGMWASLIEGATVTVDGETSPADDVTWTLGGRAYTRAELAKSTDVRWPFEEPALLTVDRARPLEPGLHEVEVSITWRWSYIPEEMQPTTNTSSRGLVLVT
jgi:hypothetical protein